MDTELGSAPVSKPEEGRHVMKRRFSWRRMAGMVFAAGLMFVLAGDKGRTSVSSTPGIDPLESLTLQIKPNVIIVLDTSGSMTNSPANHALGPDHPDSKIGAAKAVLLSAIKANESKVSFMFGTYSQPAIETLQNTNAGDDRFSYWAKDSDFPSMDTTELFLNQVYAFQTIQNSLSVKNNTLYFDEGGATIACSIPVGFYASGAALATQLATSMNACSPGNGYTVVWSAVSGAFTFSKTGLRNFRLDWGTAASSIGPVLSAGAANTALSGLAKVTGDARINAIRKAPLGTAGVGLGGNGDSKFTEAGSNITYFELVTGQFYNGQTIYTCGPAVTASCPVPWNSCGQAATITPTMPPTVSLQLVSNCALPAGSLVGTPVAFTFAGGHPVPGSTAVAGSQDPGACSGLACSGWGNNFVGCNGFNLKTQLISCDTKIPPNPLQSATIGTPYLQTVLQLDSTAGPTFGQPIGYTEKNDGTGAVVGVVNNYGVTSDGSTPISQSIADIKTIFSNLWSGSSVTVNGVTMVPPASGAISGHGPPPLPKEKTILVFVTDGDDTCSGGSLDQDAWSAAGKAQNLYNPIVGGVQSPTGVFTAGTDPDSSVTTYMVGYGTAFQKSRLNWVAWGGSGMTQGAGGGAAWPGAPTALARTQCLTCQDAFLAPTPTALAAVLDAIFNQGAQSGEFASQQSITDSIFEYVDEVQPATPPPQPFSAFAPYNRYMALTPMKFVSTFTLPGFQGQVKAFQNIAGTTTLRWSAGDKLATSVKNGMLACPTAVNAGAVVGECSFPQLHGGALDTSPTSNISTSTAAIKRRIYTTSQNGYFGETISNLQAVPPVAPCRVPLWPPNSGPTPPCAGPIVAPADDTTVGLLDAAFGLPTGVPTAADVTFLKATYQACHGHITVALKVDDPTSLHPCSSINSAAVQGMRARREAREMILAYLAGAFPSLDNFADEVTSNGPPEPKRISAGANRGDILYIARSWILGEATLATAAVVGPPLESLPLATPWVPEYQLYLNGPRTGGANSEQTSSSAAAPAPGGAIPNQTSRGFGLTDPDKDAPTGNPGLAAGAMDSRSLKPVMTVVYQGGNDMLHAFRAGPNVSSLANPCGPGGAVGSYTGVPPVAPPAPPTECGGEELWGFVPFDSLSVAASRLADQPQRRSPHDYMIAASIRFNDIFIENGTPTTLTLPGGVTQTVNGVWRKVIYFGRGISGKYLTALDVTAPGTFLQQALQTNGPVPLWNRGNPDTVDGTAAGSPVHDANDTNAYLTMGQTWSTPAVVYVDRTANLTNRNAQGVSFVAYVGSGYGNTSGCPSAPCEGSNFYALDALTGDVIKSADVEAAALTAGINRTPPPLDQNGAPYFNAIVADPIGFNPIRFKPLTSPHPSAAITTRIYVADVYGRLWKFLTGVPGPLTAIPAADLGVTQPVGTPGSLIGLNPPPGRAPGPNPYIYVTSGNDNRTNGPFAIFGFRDDGDDVTTATAGTQVFPAPSSPPGPSVTTFLPVVALFTRTFDAGPTTNASAPTPFPVFRGTVQPATAFTNDTPPRGVVFFAGTRFNPPLSAYAPVPPPYPCRSSFDSILYALGSQSGNAAYDLNATGDNAYSIFRDSRLVAIGTTADPSQTTGATLNKDEGLIKAGALPAPPPKAGQPATVGGSVTPAAINGVPQMRFGSTACQ